MKHFLLFIASLFISFLPVQSTFASANDFYFTSATFDYYLDKTAEGYSTMQVEEVFNAVFPEIDQNHGIERCLPRKSFGATTLVENSFSVTLDGSSVPFSKNTSGSQTCFRIGDANSYVHGAHTYTISYLEENVILNPNDSPNQELYWDANGNGWAQPFYSITATVHLSEQIASAFLGDGHISCYVGAYGTSGTTATSRCQSQISADGQTITFVVPPLDDFSKTSNKHIKSGETLTFDIEFSPSTFTLKPEPFNFTPIICGFIFLSALIALIIAYSRANAKVKDKKSIAKDPACPVQYTRPSGLTVAESATVWLKSAKSPQVATLMELAVNHDVSLERGAKKTFGGYHWKIHTHRTEHLTTEQKIVLEILNGGRSVHDGDIIEVKRHVATSHLESLGRSFTTKTDNSLKNKGLFESNAKSSTATTVVLSVLIFLAIMFAGPLTSLFLVQLDTDMASMSIVALFAGLFALGILAAILFTNLSKYKKRTKAGISTSKYLDGLKEYMSLAEKDRLAFLQSVEGVDTSHQGIAKLYEKLLPYAVIFGVEDSWLSELNKYYEYDDVTASNWIIGTPILSTSDFRSFTSYTTSSINSSTSSSDSGGSSGGGGGGFSGGGGGGVGGGGW